MVARDAQPCGWILRQQLLSVLGENIQALLELRAEDDGEPVEFRPTPPDTMVQPDTAEQLMLFPPSRTTDLGNRAHHARSVPGLADTSVEGPRHDNLSTIVARIENKVRAAAALVFHTQLTVNHLQLQLQDTLGTMLAGSLDLSGSGAFCCSGAHSMPAPWAGWL